MSKRNLNFMPDKRRLPNECPEEVEDWPTKTCKMGEVCHAVEYTSKVKWVEG